MRRYVVLMLAILFFSQCEMVDYYSDLNRANSELEKENYEEAILIYKEMLEKDSTQYEVWINLGLAYYGKEDWDKTRTTIQKCMELRPDDMLNYYKMGSVYCSEYKCDEAKEYLERYLDSDSELAYELPVYSGLGSCYIKHNNMLAARYYLNRAIAMDSMNYQVLTNIGFAYLDLNPKKSVGYFKTAYSLKPDRAVSNNNLGYGFYLEGELDSAHAYYQKAHEMDPLNSYVIRNMGLYQIAIGDTNQAREYLQKALKMGFEKDWGKEDLKELRSYCVKKGE